MGGLNNTKLYWADDSFLLPSSLPLPRGFLHLPIIAHEAVSKQGSRGRTRGQKAAHSPIQGQSKEVPAQALLLDPGNLKERREVLPESPWQEPLFLAWSRMSDNFGLLPWARGSARVNLDLVDLEQRTWLRKQQPSQAPSFFIYIF